jgi:hypothetical protein
LSGPEIFIVKGICSPIILSLKLMCLNGLKHGDKKEKDQDQD